MAATIAGAVIIASAAYVRDIVVAIQTAFPGQSRYIVGASVAGAVLAGLGYALVRIRENRGPRYLALAVAVAGASAYIAMFRTGIAEVDVVEAFHFVEYGVLAALFYRTWRRHADVRRLLYPLLAGVTVGVLDELFQWYLASRVGELHDVAMDLAAAGFGLLFAVAIEPLPPSVWALPARAWKPVRGATAVTVVLLGVFVTTVHVGHEIVNHEIGTFRSRYDAQTLRRVSAERAREWEHGIPPATGRFAREDFYLTEGLWHVRERNEAVQAGDLFAAWRENLILEVYFAPLLERPEGTASHRWPPEQRAMVAAAAAVHGDAAYVSRAHALPIYVF